MSLNEGKACPIFVWINMKNITKDFRNHRYSQEQTVYGAEPNEFFKEQLTRMVAQKKAKI